MRTGRVLLTCALLASLLGCAASQARPDSYPHRTLVAASPEETEKAVRDLLSAASIEVRGPDTLQTGWIEGWGDRRFGLLGGSWRRRFRLHVRLEPLGKGTLLLVRSEVEEKAPGGRLALRWRRAASDGSIEKEFLNQLRIRVERPGAEG